jgi:hypothetical protein
LESTDSRRLKTEISLEVLSNFPDETLEWKFADQEFSGFLVSSDFSESDGTGTVTMGFLDAAGTVELDWEGDSECTWGQIFGRPLRRVVYEGLCHRWTCGQFVLYGPFSQVCCLFAGNKFLAIACRCG